MNKLLISLSALSIAAASSLAMAQGTGGTGATAGTQAGVGAAVNAPELHAQLGSSSVSQ